MKSVSAASFAVPTPISKMNEISVDQMDLLQRFFECSVLQPLIDTARLTDCISSVELEQLMKQFEDFIHDPSTSAAYLVRTDDALTELQLVSRSDFKDDLVQSNTTSNYRLLWVTKLEDSLEFIAAVAVIKRFPTPDPSLSYNEQLLVVKLPKTPSTHGNSVDPSGGLNLLQKYVSLVLHPIFETITKHTNSSERDRGTQTNVYLTKQKIAELEALLARLQDDYSVPTIHFLVHPRIHEAVCSAKASNTPVTIDCIPVELLEDPKFLNALQSTVNSWIKSIQGVTNFLLEEVQGTAAQEITFYKSLATSLRDIEAQLHNDGIVLTLEVLKHAKRFHATISFLADTGIQSAYEKVVAYNTFLSEFPLSAMSIAGTFSSLQAAIEQASNHVRKRWKNSGYPLKRTITFINSATESFIISVIRIMEPKTLLCTSLEEFLFRLESAKNVIHKWNTELNEFLVLARSVIRKRKEPFSVKNLDTNFKWLLDKLDTVREFRLHHESFITALYDTSINSQFLDESAVLSLKSAYDSIVLDRYFQSSDANSETWHSQTSEYSRVVIKIEDVIISCLRNLLLNAKSTDELYDVYMNYRVYLNRTRIQNAMLEHQCRLINCIKNDIQQLKSKYSSNISRKSVDAICRLRGIPPHSGSLLWVRQILAQLDMRMKRANDVLGDSWLIYAEGAKLKTECDYFREKLCSHLTADNVLENLQSNKLNLDGCLISIAKKHHSSSYYLLTVSINIELAKCVSNSSKHQTSRKEASLPILQKIQQIQHVLPYAVGLQDCFQSYSAIESMEHFSVNGLILISDIEDDIRNLLFQGLHVSWMKFLEPQVDKSIELEEPSSAFGFYHKLIQRVRVFSHKATNLSVLLTEVDKYFCFLDKYSDIESLRSTLWQFQETLENFDYTSYTKVQLFFDLLNTKVLELLSMKLDTLLSLWTDKLSHFVVTDSFIDTLIKRYSLASFSNLFPIPVNLEFDGKSLLFNPTLSQVYRHVLDFFNVLLRQYFELPKLKVPSSSLEQKIGGDSTTVFNELYLRSCDNVLSSLRALDVYFNNLKMMNSEWIQLIPLLNLPVSNTKQLNSYDLAFWVSYLQQCLFYKNQLVALSESQSFGFVRFNLRYAKTFSLNRLYELENLALSNVADTYALEVQTLLHEFDLCRDRFEGIQVVTLPTKNAVEFVTDLGTMISKKQSFQEKVTLIKKADSLLATAPLEVCVSSETVSQRFEDTFQLLEQKATERDVSIDDLRERVKQECNVLFSEISAAIADWNSYKLNISYEDLGLTAKLLQKHLTLIEELKNSSNEYAQTSTIFGVEFSHLATLKNTYEDILHTYNVVLSVQQVDTSIHKLEDISWDDLEVKSVARELKRLIATLEDLPVETRVCPAYGVAKGLLNQYWNLLPMITELKADYFKPRHWARLFSELSQQQDNNSIRVHSLKDLLSLDLFNHSDTFARTLSSAKGEHDVDIHLQDIKEYWNNCTFHFKVYRDDQRILVCWDTLFDKSQEHLGILTSMKNSAYYHVFCDSAKEIETWLCSMNTLFTSCFEVQKLWLDLSDAFSCNSDIQALLPRQCYQFSNITVEFNTIIDQLCSCQFIASLQNPLALTQKLTVLHQSLVTLERALTEYLESMREEFPAFYFLGDQDLLQVLTTGDHLNRLRPHLKKIIPGIDDIIADDNAISIQGICSDKGEQIILEHPISLKEYSNVVKLLESLKRAIRETLQQLFRSSLTELMNAFVENDRSTRMLNWCLHYPLQVLLLSLRCFYTAEIEKCIQMRDYTQLKRATLDHINQITNTIGDLNDYQLYIASSLLNELIHFSQLINKLERNEICSLDSLSWLEQIRTYFSSTKDEINIKIATCCFSYTFEYIGTPDFLVQTELTGYCYLAMSHALIKGFGGSPCGPAGTGKTETIKALGSYLGRQVFVFNCDESFHFETMQRILTGICKLGAWVCFDEFNRLEQGTLSAVSQLVQSIQLALREINATSKTGTSVLGKVETGTALFITMNPGYIGRSELPDNLKRLFRSFQMYSPDKAMITEVTLFSQGFKNASHLAKNIVSLFDCSKQQLTSCSHYDFGLRTIKAVLKASGFFMRELIKSASTEFTEGQVLWEACLDLVGPKLIRSDLTLFKKIKDDIFGSEVIELAIDEQLKEQANEIILSENLSSNAGFVEKIIQIYKVSQVNHGIMLIGEPGVGKSTAVRMLLKTLRMVTGVEYISYILDGNILSKAALIGNYDKATREWSDGVFTKILRSIFLNEKSEMQKQHWIIFDGEISADWIEAFNSVLDDNKLLTLPNGERLRLTPNIRILFEIDNLEKVTRATITRCGMVFFDSDLIRLQDKLSSFQNDMNYFFEREETKRCAAMFFKKTNLSSTFKRHVKNTISALLSSSSDLQACFHYSLSIPHILQFSMNRAVDLFLSLLPHCVFELTERLSAKQLDLLSYSSIETYIRRNAMIYLTLACAGDSTQSVRVDYSIYLMKVFHEDEIMLDGLSLLDYHVDPNTQKLLKKQIPNGKPKGLSIGTLDTVIPTTETIRNQDLIKLSFSINSPVLLCGPPGSGKTMLFIDTIQRLPNYELVCLNFSSSTTPTSVLTMLEQHCSYKLLSKGLTLSPISSSNHLLCFCDEVNIQSTEKRLEATAVFFLRQLIEQRFFWHPQRKQLVYIENIQFAAACNPSSDYGRFTLSQRVLRHFLILMIDYPERESLLHIYNLKLCSAFRNFPELLSVRSSLCEGMVNFFIELRHCFLMKQNPCLVLSPRDLTRWFQSIEELICCLPEVHTKSVIQCVIFEAERLFCNRLIDDEERREVLNLLCYQLQQAIHNVDEETSFTTGLILSSWLSGELRTVTIEELRDFLNGRLNTYYAEEGEFPFVLSKRTIRHIVYANRIIQQKRGHMLLMGECGTGRSAILKFVSWMNNYKFFEIPFRSSYKDDDFEADLRQIIQIVGLQGEKVCFMIDDTVTPNSFFIEKMNTLLANSEFSVFYDNAEDWNKLLTEAKVSASTENIDLKTEQEIYTFLKNRVSENLHVMITMEYNPKNATKALLASPALFNRCVVNYFTPLDYEEKRLLAVSALESLIAKTPLLPSFASALREKTLALAKAFVEVSEVPTNYTSRCAFYSNIPANWYSEFLRHFFVLIKKRYSHLLHSHSRLDTGLLKLCETHQEVAILKESLRNKEQELTAKDTEANQSLQQMAGKKEIAEDSRRKALEFENVLKIRSKEIEARKQQAMHRLADVKPKLLKAKESVSCISKQQLIELRSMGHPPDTVKLAMESVCFLLGYKFKTWRDVQSLLRKDDLIPNILNYKLEKELPRGFFEVLNTKYFNNPNYSYENANRASRACGPLVLWVQSQVSYAQVVNDIKPLEQEIDLLTKQNAEAEETMKATQSDISNLQEEIEIYRANYAKLLQEIEQLKTEMVNVNRKIEKSEKLLAALNNEKQRWEVSVSGFEKELEFLIGDTLLLAFYIDFCGYADLAIRHLFIKDCLQCLDSCDISYNKHLPFSELLVQVTSGDYNSTDAQKLENMAVLENSLRRPFIIDPTARVIPLLQNLHAKQHPVVTSFLSAAFVKQFEAALQFRTPLIVKDADSWDPIVNSVLAKASDDSSSKVTVCFNKRTYEINVPLQVYFVTQKTDCFINSRTKSLVCFVNYSLTPNNLELSAIDKVLKLENIDIGQKLQQNFGLKTQYTEKLKTLEDTLLESISKLQGTILENDSVISTLQQVKEDAEKVETLLAANQKATELINLKMSEYAEIAQACRQVYQLLSALSCLSPAYQFSLDFVDKVFSKSLSLVHLEFLQQGQSILELVLEEFFKNILESVLPSLFMKDKDIFALFLIQLKYPQYKNALLCLGFKGEPEDMLAHIRESGIIPNDIVNKLVASTTIDEKSISQLYCDIPKEKTAKQEFLLQKLILYRTFVRERFLEQLQIFLSTVFGDSYNLSNRTDLLQSLKEESSPDIPLLLASVPGHDASSYAEECIQALQVQFHSISLGSSESETEAMNAISDASKRGGMVLLKNVHLSINILNQLLPYVSSLKKSKSFRLILTLELSSSPPTDLFYQSRFLIYDGASNLKQLFLSSFIRAHEFHTSSFSALEERVCFLVCWIYAVFLRRLDYGSLGWSKPYDFNEVDLSLSIKLVEEWALSSKKRVNSPNVLVPWDAFQLLLSRVIYGGKVSDENDTRVLNTIIAKLLREESLSPACNLSLSDSSNLVLPVLNSFEDYTRFAETMPQSENSEWFGLVKDAKSRKTTSETKEFLETFSNLQAKLSELS